MSSSKTKYSIHVQCLQLALMCMAVILLPTLGYADTIAGEVGGSVCGIADKFQGNLGRGIATIGIVTIGVAASVGRVSWTQALIVGVGCASLAAAPAIVAIIGGGNCL